MRSETELSSDILQPIPLEDWPLLQELLKVDWPNHSDLYYWIQNSIKWKKQDPNLSLEIYSPQGKYQEDTTFVGISSFSMYDVIIFTKDPSGKRLYEALVQTNRFDWSKEVAFGGVDDYIEPILLSALDLLRTNRGIEIKTVIPCRIYFKSADDCANVKIEVPEECYFKDLNLSHLSMIHSLWPYVDKDQPENSTKLLRTIIVMNKNIGLFLKKGDVLVSWVLQNEWHGLGITHTLKSYRRRGYAEVVVNALAKCLGKEGISSTSTVACGNTASENFSQCLNFKPIKPCVWIIMKKHIQSTTSRPMTRTSPTLAARSHL